MRILHTIYDHPENPWLGGGGAFRTFEICKRLANRHEITILCGNYPGASGEKNQDGLRIIHVGSPRSYITSRLSNSALATRFVASQHPDLWTYSFSAFAPIIASAKSRQTAILECFHLMQEHATEKHPLLGCVAAATETATLNAYDDVISISPSVSKEIASLRGCSEGIRVVYTGVDTSCFIDDSVEGDYILYFGRLDTYTKGLDTLLEAFSRLPQTGPRLIVAGRGTKERVVELRKLIGAFGISNRVTLTSSVDTETKTALFRESLFNVAPSRYEGWCIAAVEASAASKAVVGTRIPGLMDAVKDGKTGLLAEPGDVSSLAEAMRRLIDDPSLRQQLGKHGREWANQFTWENVALAQEKMYLDVIDRRTRNSTGAP
ncbi:MAG: glycosyltransferase family 4 protein [Candidatus Latescibacterota bacterium]|nr:glycosyltransferase family 4 protein [Candidatus Latescibacterota bacterium]